MGDAPISVQCAFAALAGLVLFSALCAMRTRSIVHAGFWLLPCFIGIAGLFGSLEAHFFFVMQLLIYAGAILVLLLFALMLTRDVMNPNVPQTNRYGGVAALFCAAFAAVVSWIVVRQPWPLSAARPAPAAEQTIALGKALIDQYAIPFEVASLVLLAALFGAVVLAKLEREPMPERAPLAIPEEPAGVAAREEALVGH